MLDKVAAQINDPLGIQMVVSPTLLAKTSRNKSRPFPVQYLIWPDVLIASLALTTGAHAQKGATKPRNLTMCAKSWGIK